MGRFRHNPFLYGVLLVLASIGLILTRFSVSAQPPAGMLKQFDQPYPSHGWRVCADRGLGIPPGLPGPVQIMELCQGEGWRVQAYCLEPLEPAPPVDTFCSFVGDRTFWCGDQYQLIREYIILQTAQPTATYTTTPTITFTPIPTSTHTLQPPLTVTPTTTNTITVVVSEVAATPTVFVRPAPGGKGNREIFTGISLIALSLWVIGMVGILRWRRSLRSE